MLKQRVITAIVLVTVFLSLLFAADAVSWLGFAALVAALAGWEWHALAHPQVADCADGACGTPTTRRVARTLFSVLCAMLTLALGVEAGLTFATPDAVRSLALVPILSASVVFWLLAGTSWLRWRWRIAQPGLGLLIGLLLIVPPAVALAYLRQHGALAVLATLAIVWLADIAAYFSGRAFGRHKLAPQISPGKTWEGAAGAVVGVLAYGFVLGPQAFPGQGWGLGLAGWAAALMVLTALSIMGDLFESLAKRQAGVKDSGTLLPGHGGVLDRIDSLTSTLPLVALATLLLG